MQINSTPLGSPPRLLIDASDTHTDQAQEIASNSP
jgi:hypothetical protein